MRHCVVNPFRGWTLKPTRRWNGKPNFEFLVRGLADADCAKDPDMRHSISGCSAILEDAPVAAKSKGQATVTSSVTKLELTSGANCAQDVSFVMRQMQSLKLKVKSPMKLKIDDKGAVDFTNSWTIGGRIWHVDIRPCFLRELKELGIVETE